MTLENCKTQYLISLETTLGKEQGRKSFYWLLEKSTQKSNAFLITHPEYTLSKKEQEDLAEAINKIVNKQYPLQYILGSVPFGPLEITVKKPTLIPRPETEQWVYQLIEDLTPFKNQPLTILDMCTGSGCIALSLAHALPQAHIYAVDNSKQALDLASSNANKLSINTIHVVNSNLFEALEKQIQFDFIVSNPPYVTESEYDSLEPSVKNWEDKNALVAQNNGLKLIEKIIQKSPAFLKAESPIINKIPRLIMEIGYKQGQTVKELFKQSGFDHVVIKKDFADKDRIVCGF